MMANAGFTRDEVILTLDALYSSGAKRLSAKAQDIKELCAVLRKLPIHRLEMQDETFRTESGVSGQLSGFCRSCEIGEKDPHVGKIFFTVAFEFENNKKELHRIAESIRRNMPYYYSNFGNPAEDEGFREGILLGHLHKLLEARDGARIKKDSRCAVCQLEPDILYKSSGGLLQQHLLVSPSEMDGQQKYSADNFITVCPNCHAALHRYRPWLDKENCGELLR